MKILVIINKYIRTSFIMSIHVIIPIDSFHAGRSDYREPCADGFNSITLFVQLLDNEVSQNQIAWQIQEAQISHLMIIQIQYHIGHTYLRSVYILDG